jgi:hypothetical protein
MSAIFSVWQFKFSKTVLQNFKFLLLLYRVTINIVRHIIIPNLMILDVNEFEFPIRSIAEIDIFSILCVIN